MYIIHYGKHYPDMPYQDQECWWVQKAKGKPFNVLVCLFDGTLIVVPYGNLKKK